MIGSITPHSSGTPYCGHARTMDAEHGPNNRIKFAEYSVEEVLISWSSEVPPGSEMLGNNAIDSLREVMPTESEGLPSSLRRMVSILWPEMERRNSMNEREDGRKKNRNRKQEQLKE